MALPATDDFTDDDGTTLTDHSASWTICNGGFSINSNAVYPSSSGDECLAGWNDDAFDDDQYAEGPVESLSSGIVGVAVRCDVTTPAGNGYAFYADGGDVYLWRADAGAYNELDTAAQVVEAGDTLRIEAEGTTIRGLVNDVEVCSAVDATYSGGAAGVSGYGDNVLSRLDSWEGGDLSSGPGPRSVVVATI